MMTAGSPTVADARVELFGLAAELLSFPTDSLAQTVRDGRLARAVAHLVAHLPYTVELEAGGLWLPDLKGKVLEGEFIRLFDVPDGPPTPLYTGVYAGQRRDAMEELLRFYRHFGLTLAPGAHDVPDAVPTVLEFLSFLVLLEAGAPPNDGSLAAARGDVASRHLLPWAQQTAVRLASRRPHPFYAAAVSLVSAMARAEAGTRR